jgi:hypothetical protein
LVIKLDETQFISQFYDHVKRLYIEGITKNEYVEKILDYLIARESPCTFYHYINYDADLMNTIPGDGFCYYRAMYTLYLRNKLADNNKENLNVFESTMAYRSVKDIRDHHSQLLVNDNYLKGFIDFVNLALNVANKFAKDSTEDHAQSKLKILQVLAKLQSIQTLSTNMREQYYMANSNDNPTWGSLTEMIHFTLNNQFTVVSYVRDTNKKENHNGQYFAQLEYCNYFNKNNNIYSGIMRHYTYQQLQEIFSLNPMDICLFSLNHYSVQLDCKHMVEELPIRVRQLATQIADLFIIHEKYVFEVNLKKSLGNDKKVNSLREELKRINLIIKGHEAVIKRHQELLEEQKILAADVEHQINNSQV